MKLRSALYLALLLPLFTSGCIATGAVIAGALVLGHASRTQDTVGMNYHADLETTWDAALAEARAMDVVPDPEKTRLEPEGGLIHASNLHATVKPLEQYSGTRIEVTPDSADDAAADRADAFLRAVADRLNEFSEIVRDYRASLQQTWDAAQAQLAEMGLGPTREGTKLTSDHGRILVGDLKIEIERVRRNATRAHVFFTVDATPEHLQQARSLLDGIESRL
jgi:hypothetical protein